VALELALKTANVLEPASYAVIVLVAVQRTLSTILDRAVTNLMLFSMVVLAVEARGCAVGGSFDLAEPAQIPVALEVVALQLVAPMSTVMTRASVDVAVGPSPILAPYVDRTYPSRTRHLVR
jgi:hypothetical protein